MKKFSSYYAELYDQEFGGVSPQELERLLFHCRKVRGCVEQVDFWSRFAKRVSQSMDSISVPLSASTIGIIPREMIGFNHPLIFF